MQAGSASAADAAPADVELTVLVPADRAAAGAGTAAASPAQPPPAGQPPGRPRTLRQRSEDDDMSGVFDGQPTSPIAANRRSFLTQLSGEVALPEDALEDVLDADEDGCLCCKRFCAMDVRRISTDNLILEKDRLNMRQLLNNHDPDVDDPTKDYQDSAKERAAMRERNCLAICTEYSIAANCVKVPFSKRGATQSCLFSIVQVVWIVFLVLFWTANKIQRQMCAPHPFMRPGLSFRSARYECLDSSILAQMENLTTAEQFAVVKSISPAAQWAGSKNTTEAFLMWQVDTRSKGPIEWVDALSDLFDTGIVLSCMLMFHFGTSKEAMYPLMLDETFFSGAGTASIAVKRPRKLVQQVAAICAGVAQVLSFAFSYLVCESSVTQGSIGECVTSSVLLWMFLTSTSTILGVLVAGLFVQMHNSTVMANLLQQDWSEGLMRTEKAHSAHGRVEEIVHKIASLVHASHALQLVTEHSTDGDGTATPEGERKADEAGGPQKLDTFTIQEEHRQAVHRAADELLRPTLSMDHGGNRRIPKRDSQFRIPSHGKHRQTRVENNAWGALYKKVISALHVWSWRWSPPVLSMIMFLVINMCKGFSRLTRRYFVNAALSDDDEIKGIYWENGYAEDGLTFLVMLFVLFIFLLPVVYIDVFYRRLRVLVALHRLEWTENFERLHQGHGTLYGFAVSCLSYGALTLSVLLLSIFVFVSAAFTLFDFPVRVDFALQCVRVLFLSIFVVIVGLVAAEANVDASAGVTITPAA